MLPIQTDPPQRLSSPSFFCLLLLEKTIWRESMQSATRYRPAPSQAASIHVRLELGAERAHTYCVALPSNRRLSLEKKL